MDLMHQYFLEILRCMLHRRPEEIPGSLAPEQWQQLFALARRHKLLPMFYEAACTQPSLQGQPVLAAARRQVLGQVMEQTVKTADFLKLYARLTRAGITPLVVKGILCRSLYPQPDHRLSSDEDLLVSPEQFARAEAALLELGMEAVNRNPGQEISFRSPVSPLYIELHCHLFPPEELAYGELNQFFGDIFTRAQTVTFDSTPILAPDHTDHLFYLICHSLKHFLHGGVGIRQICDILMYAKTWGQRIDWDLLTENCRRVQAQFFAAALFRIGVNHLGFSPEALRLPPAWAAMDLDELPLLEDLLEGGIYGTASDARQHSSSITLNAARGGEKTGSLAAALFPPARQLQSRYPYLRRHPWLLPVAWVSRAASYKKGAKTSLEALELGNQRLKLLKQYGIIKKP